MNKLGKNTDVLLAFGIIFILGLMLIPLPAGFLDFFLALNITASVLLLIVSLYIQKPLDIYVFPSLLLVLTIFRLALNISSTRLILIEGFAGKVIESFGSFVVGGNFVVGFIIFIILVIIQFIVIIKGSGRISEVAARFTLDAMPGKQMAIDADLNTGLITETEARQRRESVSKEAEFHGSMDGASKFVKGDAIAGLLINAINIIGGLVIGVAQRDLSLSDALQTYTILTIGDGLVSQVPALLIATSAGLVITRNTSGSALDMQIKAQLFGNPKVLATVAVIMLLFSIIPGMPTVPFVILSVGLGAGSYFTKKRIQSEDHVIIDEQEEEPASTEERVEQYLQVDPIEIEIGYGLINLVDEEQGGNLFHKISSTRKYIALEYGVLVPPVRVRDNLQLDPNAYLIKIKGNVVTQHELYTDRYLAMNPGNIDDPIDGIETTDPAFNLPSCWVASEQKDKAELLGYTVVDSVSVLSTHLQETLKRHFDKILSRQAVKQLLENLKEDYPAVIDDINSEVLSLGTIQKVLQNLLKELIPIKDLVQILEALIDYSKVTKNVDVLTEYVRHSIGDTIANIYIDANGIIHGCLIGDQLEMLITNSLKEQKEATNTLGLNPVQINQLNMKIEEVQNKFRSLGYTPIIIASAAIRPYFFRLINSSFTDFVVLSYSELPPTAELEFIDKLELGNEG
ncbi:MAG: flagellar biosynthesis protein FlhA [Ignavibacteriae bacterium]|nr:flagellar biosynthesis protein FlhA [Ignavibacteriota bacterium]NOG97153.1 flagellar biosynthesis protein FlhA [Ignavibacteriota bacterium]